MSASTTVTVAGDGDDQESSGEWWRGDGFYFFNFTIYFCISPSEATHPSSLPNPPALRGLSGIARAQDFPPEREFLPLPRPPLIIRLEVAILAAFVCNV